MADIHTSPIVQTQPPMQERQEEMDDSEKVARIRPPSYVSKPESIDDLQIVSTCLTNHPDDTEKCNGTSDDGPARPLLPGPRRIMLGAAMMCTTILASVSINSALIIVPPMAIDLGISELAAQWIVSAYTLSAGCGLLVAGRLADLYGRKYLFLVGLTLNAVCSLCAAFIRNYIGLSVIRAFAGIGQAIASPAAFGIVGSTFNIEPERTIAFAVFGLGYPIGAATGQVIGGLIAGTSRHAWQYQFFFFAGLATFTAISGAIVIPREPTKLQTPNRRIDWLGAVLITAALSLFSFSITQAGLVSGGWTNPYIPVLFVVSICLIGAFGYWEHYVLDKTTLPPLVDLRLFRRHGWKVTAILVYTFSAYTAISGWVYMTTVWYQTFKHETTIQNVLHVLPAPIVGLFACILVPILAPRIRAPNLLFFGGFMTAAACWLYAVQPIGTSYWACEFVANIANPFGADFTTGIGSVIISNLAAEHEQSLIGALFQTALQLSATIGVCLCSLVQEVVERKTGNLHTALVTAWWMIAGFAWLSCLIVVVALRKIGLAKDVGKKFDSGQLSNYK